MTLRQEDIVNCRQAIQWLAIYGATDTGVQRLIPSVQRVVDFVESQVAVPGPVAGDQPEIKEL